MFSSSDTTILCIDLQEKLVKMLGAQSSVAQNAAKLMSAASILNIDTIITEQYPKGLGDTISAIKSIKPFKTLEKTTFSALQTAGFPGIKNKNIILFGIETHICVFQTALDLIDKGYSVFIAQDCCGSRCERDKSFALEYLKQKGVAILTLEIILFEFLKSSKHPKFKEIQALIK